jgi:hypothetical protein
MRGKVCAVVFAVSVLAPAALASAALASTRMSLKPGLGKPTTAFVLSFRAPVKTGSFGAVRTHYQVYASGPKGTGCVASVSIALRPTRRHAHVRVTLRPKRHGGVWCVGRFRGRVAELETTVCQPTLACPDFVIAPRTIGRFSFRVSKPAPGSGTQKTGPSFAGLTSATTCSPVTPKVTPQGKTYTLTWSPATDPVTPSSQIVYDIYYSATSGGEDYSNPLKTTLPGATSATVQTASLGAAYFVVRARDKAGLEDHNTVERLAVNTCSGPPGDV